MSNTGYSYIPKGTQKSHKREITAKELAYTKKLLANGGNGTKAALEAYNTTDRNVAGVISAENLRKPRIISKLHEIMAMDGEGIELKQVIQTHKRNLLQDKNLKVSQQAVGDYYRATRMIGSEAERPSVQVALVINESGYTPPEKPV